MKVLIEIDENVYTRLFDNGIQDNEIATDDICEMARALRLGIPIPDNATNGDMIKAMFPNTEVDDYDYGKDPVIDVYGIDDTEYITLRKAWWNSPYQKGGKK